jgi:hypothetical protein
MRYLWIIAAGVLLLVVLGNIGSVAWNWGRPYLTNDPLAGFPRMFLWAWERPEDLSFLDPRKAGVAVLAKTLILSKTGIAIHPRMQPIELPPGVTTIAVVRIETKSDTISEQTRKEAVRQITDLTSSSSVGIQLDFDARASERDLYRKLLSDVRRQMPSGKKLSITALASWCIYDDWISDLPVDESVPMLFRMGIGEAEVKRYLANGGDFRAARTRFSIGISLDELPAKKLGSRRIYIFNPKPWTPSSVEEALRYAREWQ